MGSTMTMGWLSLLVWISFLVLVTLGAAYLVRSLSSRNTPEAPTGLAILEQRFARGEIDLAEFEERRRALQS